MHSLRLVIEDNAEAVAHRAAEMIRAAHRECHEQRRTFHFVLAGGSTPLPVYRELVRCTRESALDWTDTVFYFGDERCVPPDHPDSNYKMASESFLLPLGICPEAVRRMEAERDDTERAVAEYESLLPGTFDLILLGMGDDGHTLSLFPGSPILHETRRLVAMTDSSPKPPRRRMTLTPAALDCAARRLVIVTGTAKAGMLARVLATPADPPRFPIQLALDGTWMLDRDAAACLPEQGKP